MSILKALPQTQTNVLIAGLRRTRRLRSGENAKVPRLPIKHREMDPWLAIKNTLSMTEAQDLRQFIANSRRSRKQPIRAE